MRMVFNLALFTLCLRNVTQDMPCINIIKMITQCENNVNCIYVNPPSFSKGVVFPYQHYSH